ncbi:hypothetical protein [Paenibacillus lautus]|uniref:hypothetical protein n=1 Tax=Paenibacillus lautus TaxID=1401 RepID=UPI001BCB4B23|nr:hypothetical protein [Paenibacillus lautus]
MTVFNIASGSANPQFVPRSVRRCRYLDRHLLLVHRRKSALVYFRLHWELISAYLEEVSPDLLSKGL